MLAVDPNYNYAYYQQGQILESLGDEAQAKARYLAGIDAATRTNDAKAKGELEAAMDMMG